MKDYIPLRPAGYDPEAKFDQSIHGRAYGALKVNNSRTVKVRRSTSGGITLNVDTLGGVGTAVRPYLVTSLHNLDFVGAKLYDPVSEKVSGNEVSIAKSITARMISREKIDGIVFDYDYDSLENLGDNFRIQLQSDAIWEYHVCHPRYRVFNPATPINDATNPAEQYLIYAAKVTKGTGVVDGHGVMIKICEIAPTRFWAYQFDQSGPPTE